MKVHCFNTGTHTHSLLKDVVKVADVLTRHLYRHGDKLLEEDTPIALSVNEMYSITKRLRLPMDAQGVGGWSQAAVVNIPCLPLDLSPELNPNCAARRGLPPQHRHAITLAAKPLQSHLKHSVTGYLSSRNCNLQTLPRVLCGS